MAESKSRVRRSYGELFMAALSDLSKGQQILVGNGALQERLGWDDTRYDRIKGQLVDENAIIVGRGRGGSVGLANAPGTKAALSAVVSYSHTDEALKTALLKHLAPLTRIGLIDTWHDRKIKPGEEWDKVISDKFENASIILLLISIDFINSPYCYDIELEKAMERHDAGKAKVIPIILRACLWNHTSFAKLQALPRDAKAITGWEDQDEALSNVAEGVMQVARELFASIK
jgi:TIR domain